MKIKIIEVETGSVVNSQEPQTSRGARSKTQQQKDSLINYLLYGKKDTSWISTDYFISDKEFLDLSVNFATGTLKDLFFFAKAISYTREMSYDSSYPILALYALSCSDRREAKEHFKRIFNTVIQTQEDLILFLSLVKTKQLRGFGKLYQKTITKWINKLNKQELLEFYANTVAISRPNFTLADIIKYCHIKSNNEEVQAIYNFITKKKTSIHLPNVFPAVDRLFQILALSTTSTTLSERNSLVINNNIPLYLAIALRCENEALSTAVKRSKLADIIKNIQSIIVRGGFRDQETIQYVCALLRNKQIVENSGLSVFSFIMAMDSNQNLPVSIYESLRFAINILMNNIEKSEKSVAIFIDQGSTFGVNSIHTNVSDQSIANTVGSFFSFVSKRSSILPFDNKVKPVHPIEGSDILSVVEQISSLGRPSEIRWGTPFKFLFEQANKYDYIIFITSRVPWRKVLIETEAGSLFSSYLNTVHQTAKAFFVNLTPNNDNRTSHALNNVFLIDGFNVNSSRFILEHIYDKIEQRRDLIDRSLITA